MTEIAAMASIARSSSDVQVTLANVGNAVTPQSQATASNKADAGFDAMLGEAISTLDSKVAKADQMVAQFAVDNTTPIHHVTVALEEARMAVELATQVRQRLVEGYRELMNMQL